MNAFAISSILIVISNVSLAAFVLWKSKDKKIKRIWTLFCYSIVLWGIGGYGFSTAASKEDALFWWQIAYMGPIFVPIFYYHFLYIFLGLNKKLHKYILIGSYLLGFTLSIIELLYPQKFFGNLRFAFGHLYFPDSFFPINFYFISYINFYWILLTYAFWQLIVSYKNSQGLFKSQLKYFLIGSIVGWLGPHGFFLNVWGFNTYPYSNFLIAIYPIIFTFGMLKYQLMDINIIIKKTLIYSGIIALISGLIFGVSFLNSWFADNISGFKVWMIPLAAGIVAFFIGNLFYRKSKEVDKLKYEFITVAAHKLRTPLTEVKWATDALDEKSLNEEEKKNLTSGIKSANSRLIALTDELLSIAKTEAGQYQYKFEPADFEKMVRNEVNDCQRQFQEKGIKLNYNYNKDLPKINIDKIRMSMVIQILLENAVTYTKNRIDISIAKDKNDILFSIKDNGIGINKEDLPYIFSKFYRSHDAYLTETEGEGIGLYLAKSIIEKHGGKIGVNSEGEDKGSEFWVQIKL